MGAIVLAGGVFLITRGGDESETLAFAEETTGAQPTDDLVSTPTDADTVDGAGPGEDADAGETAGDETSAASPADEAATAEVTGHTDSDGSDAANLQLSQARVDAVRAFFASQGIDGDRIATIGKGETEPRADNATADGRRANRRVEFLVKGFSVGG